METCPQLSDVTPIPCTPWAALIIPIRDPVAVHMSKEEDGVRQNNYVCLTGGLKQFLSHPEYRALNADSEEM